MLYRHPEIKQQLVKKKLSPEEQAKIIIYWLVEITLTSGEILQFYVSGLTLFDAQEKALVYQSWIGNDKLQNKLKVFRLMP